MQRQLRRAHARARSAITGPRAHASQPISHKTLPYHSRSDWHVLRGKSFETEENASPDFEFCDFAMTMAAGSKKNWHTENTSVYAPYGPPDQRIPSERERGHDEPDPFAQLAVADAARVLREKTKFCAFVSYDPLCRTRHRFVEILSRSMRVEAGGRVMRSVRYALEPREAPNYPAGVADFYRPYKFVIAFENSLALDYASEKVWTAIQADAVPIYWGNPQIANWCNPERFINAFDFDNLDNLARHAMRVHQDNALYLRYLSAPARTLRQDVAPFARCRYYVKLSDIARDFHTDRKAFVGFYQGLTEKHRKSFLHRYNRLMTGRMLPLSQRCMFSRECLSRFGQAACERIAQDRLHLAGWESRREPQGRHAASWRHVWPHPAFYQVVDMHGQLDAKD